MGAGNGFCFDETFYHRMHAVRDVGPTVTVHVFPSADAGVGVGVGVGDGAAPGVPTISLGLP